MLQITTTDPISADTSDVTTGSIELRAVNQPRLPIALTLHTNPVGSNPTGTTIAFTAKLQHSPDGTFWEDVASGAVTTIASGAESTSTKVFATTAVIHRFIRASYNLSITGSPNWQSGVVATIQIYES